MLDTSKIYTTKNNGDLRIIKYKNYYDVDVEFIKTGYRTKVRSDHVSRGMVRDLFHTSVHGVGFVGLGKYDIKINRKCYHIWRGMLGRCYNFAMQERRPTYKDVTVCDEWHNFQVFAEWFEGNYIKGLYLDKDIKIKGNKVYSPEACSFVSMTDNNIEANAKHYSFISPNGLVVDIYNLNAFCRDNSLIASCMGKVALGINKHHKQWVKA